MPNESSSFIPKSGVKTVKRSQGTKQIYLLAYISYIVFFSTLFAVLGVYIYGAMVNRSLNNLKEEMVAEKERFAVTDIENIKQLNKRIDTAETLLGEATAPSRIFPDIESIVASNIRFSGMSYEQLPNRQFQIDLTGEAGDFNEIIGQRLLLENSTLLSDAEVVEYDYSVSGEEGSSVSGEAVLTFVFSDTRDLSAIAYLPPAETEMEEFATSSENLIIDDSVTPASIEDTATTAATTTGNIDN